MIRVFVAADVRFYEEGVAQALRADGRFEVAGTARGAGAALAQLRVLAPPPDVLLLDAAMPDARAAADAVHEQLPAMSVVALAVREVEDDVLAWAEVGVDALIERSASLDSLMTALVRVAAGDSVVSPRMTATLLRRVSTAARTNATATAAFSLTQREQEVAGLMARGLSNKEIALDLRIGLSTVKNHVHNILEKLHVRGRTEVAALVAERTQKQLRI